MAYGIAQFGVETAEAYVLGFDASFALISDYPLIGAVHDAVRPPIHGLPRGSHYVLYDVSEDRVVVQRVLHKSMDLERWF